MGSVCEIIVPRNWCVGCGFCAAVCPRKRLRIALNETGEYRPTEENTCDAAKCQLCLGVCPANDENVNENELGKRFFAGNENIIHREECGYFYDAHLGFSTIPGDRENSASGGLLTWTLISLLNSGRVDAVIAVGANAEVSSAKHPYFAFRVCRTEKEIRECSRSCYYPVEVSNVVRYILENEGKYVIVALPCLAKAIRLAQERFPKLKERIKFILGLVCGQGKSTFFTEYVTSLAGGNPQGIESIQFRVKNSEKPATDYGLLSQTIQEDGTRSSQTLFWNNGMSAPWLKRYFTPSGCHYCDDVFAECADAVYMDAWLPEYQNDWRGTSIVISRNRDLSSLFQTSKDAQIEEIPIDKAIRSQKGVLDQKRTQMSVRLALLQKKNKPIPKKRYAPNFRAVSFFPRKEIELKLLYSEITGKLWLESGRNHKIFDTKIKRLTDRFQRPVYFLRLLEKIQNKLKKLLGR